MAPGKSPTAAALARHARTRLRAMADPESARGFRTYFKKDDEVVTTGGIYGKIVSLDDRVVTLEIADKVKIKILRDRIAGRWNPAQPPAKK